MKRQTTRWPIGFSSTEISWPQTAANDGATPTANLSSVERSRELTYAKLSLLSCSWESLVFLAEASPGVGQHWPNSA